MRRAVLLLLASCACGSGVHPIEPSPVGDAPALIVFALYGDRVEAHAVDLSAEDASLALTFDDGVVDLFTMLLAEDLTALDLAEGPLALARGGARPFPEATAIYRSRIDRGVQSEWSAMDALPAELAELAIDLPAIDVCRRLAPNLSVTSFELETKSSVSWGARVTPSRALVQTIDGQLYLVDATGAERIVLDRAPPGGAGFQGPDGTLWVANALGVWRAAADELLFERVGDGMPDPYPLRLVGPTESGAPVELFALGSQGFVERWDGDRWERLGRATPSVNGDLAWIAPEHVVAVREGISDVQWIDHGREVRRQPDIASSIGFTAVSWFGGDLALGGVDGHVYVERGEGWMDLGQAMRDQVFALVEEGDTLLAAGLYGRVARVSADGELCSEALAPSHISGLLPLEGGYVALQANLDVWDDRGEPRYLTPISWLARP